MRFWPVAALVFIAVAAGEDAKLRADSQVDARVSDAKASEHLASLERSVIALEATVNAQARQMHCFEAQRAARAAWSAHEASLLPITATDCNEVAGICPDTGLPPNTFGRYQLLVSPVAGETDAPYGALRVTMDDLPKLPQARVPGDAFTRIRSTRAAAESATKAYLAEGDPAEASP